MKYSSLPTSLTARIKGLSLAWISCICLYSCTWEQVTNPVLWGLKFLSARQPYQGPSQALLPRPLKSALPMSIAPAYRVTNELTSVDTHGLRRLQIWVTTASARNTYKYIYRDLVAHHHLTHDIIWITLSAQGRTQSLAEWFNPAIAPHERHRITRQEELYAGVHIEYQP